MNIHSLYSVDETYCKNYDCVHDCFLILFQSMSAASGGSNPVANYKFSDSEISKLLNIPLDQIAESNQDVPAQKANPDSGKSSSQCDNQNFLPKVRKKLFNCIKDIFGGHS